MTDVVLHGWALLGVIAVVTGAGLRGFVLGWRDKAVGHGARR